MSEVHKQYEIAAARERLEKDARRSAGAVYNPFSDSARRIRLQAIRPLTARKSLALYFYQMAVLIVVVGTFIAVAWR